MLEDWLCRWHWLDQNFFFYYWSELVLIRMALEYLYLTQIFLISLMSYSLYPYCSRAHVHTHTLSPTLHSQTCRCVHTHIVSVRSALFSLSLPCLLLIFFLCIICFSTGSFFSLLPIYLTLFFIGWLYDGLGHICLLSNPSHLLTSSLCLSLWLCSLSFWMVQLFSFHWSVCFSLAMLLPLLVLQPPSLAKQIS